MAVDAYYYLWILAVALFVIMGSAVGSAGELFSSILGGADTTVLLGLLVFILFWGKI